MDLADLPRRPLTVGAPAAEIVARDVARALAEDIGAGDASAALIDADARGKAEVVARESMVLAGCAWFDACLRTLDPAARIDWRHRDGDRVDAGEVLCAVEANARALLRRKDTGRGDYIDVSMHEALMASCANVVGSTFAENKHPDVKQQRTTGGSRP